MAAPLTAEDLTDCLSRGGWRKRFGDAALAAGAQLARARQVAGIRGECLDTGDAELSGTVTEKSGEVHRPVVAFWREGGGIALESSCTCAVSVQCAHAAALLEQLARDPGPRVQAALGGTPAAPATSPATMRVLPPSLPSLEPPRIEPTAPTGPPTSSGPLPEEGGEGPRFLLRLERRTADNDRLAWLPERHARAWACYGPHRAPLDPSGNLAPLATSGGRIRRDRAAETAALNLLYALDFLPGAEEPPQSLRKLARPVTDGTLWAPNRQEWPDETVFWQRFRHEGVPALERRGWEVRFAADFGLEPLVFRSQTWRAEIVEEGRGWFHLSAGFEIDGESFELQPILAALVANRFLEATAGLPDGQEFLILLPDGRALALPVGRFRRILLTLGDLTEFRFSGGPIRLGRLDAARLAGDPATGLAVAPPPPEIAALAAGLGAPGRVVSLPPPSGLRASLRDYQLEGYRWMQFLAGHGLNGILADDMGLGKTLQTLAHLLAEIESGRGGGRPSLVIAPTSVVENWQREAAKFAPGLRVLVLQGPERLAGFRRIPGAELVLSSYALIGRDLDAYLGQEFHLLVLDEAQHIKNPDAQVSQALVRLRARHRLCLSGTPVENHLGELWSLMHFLMPGLLGTREAFTETYRTPIERHGDADRRAALTRRVGPLILRRTKREVAKELPPKTEIVHAIEMSEGQKDLYETVRSTMDKQVRQALAIRGQQAQIVFLDALLKLRQICCHPRLLEGRGGEEAGSAKFDHLAGLLDTFREEGNRVLLFSQFTSMLDLIEAHLQAEGFRTLKLTGGTRNRQELVERFQAGEGEVFLISLKAGGTGLTLTGADIVIHYDPWWNPAAEDQATDRAYRIGQDKPVFVHKLICRGTVEERIQQMQDRKGDLAADLLSGASRALPLTTEVLADLLGPSD